VSLRFKKWPDRVLVLVLALIAVGTTAAPAWLVARGILLDRTIPWLAFFLAGWGFIGIGLYRQPHLIGVRHDGLVVRRGRSVVCYPWDSLASVTRQGLQVIVIARGHPTLQVAVWDTVPPIDEWLRTEKGVVGSPQDST